MRRLFLPVTLALATASFAVDVELHGSVNADYASYFDEDFDPTNAANQDIDLSATAHLDENVSVTVMANTHSSYLSKDGKKEASETRRHYFAHSTAIGSEDTFTEFNFDGIELRWDVTSGVSLVFGDLIYSAGAFNYFYWRDPSRYAAIIREEAIRGVGVEVGTEKFGHGKVYLGASDNNEHSAAIFATYSLPLINHVNEHLVLTPSVDWMFGNEIDRTHAYSLGLEVDYSKSLEIFNYGIYAVWGLHPYKENGVHTFLLEPSMNYAFFNLAATFFYAITDGENPVFEESGRSQIMTEDQMLFAIEPSFNLHKKLTLGVNYEYHDKDAEIDDDEYQYLGLNFYLYPTMKTELVFWVGYNFSENVDTDLAMGISAKVDF